MAYFLDKQFLYLFLTFFFSNMRSEKVAKSRNNLKVVRRQKKKKKNRERSVTLTTSRKMVLVYK